MRKLVRIMAGVLCVAALAACGRKEETAENVFQIYTVSNTETKVETHPHEMKATDAMEQLNELLEALSTQPEKLEYKAPLGMGFQLVSVGVEQSNLVMDFNEDYRTLAPSTEVLVRAAVVRTLTQLANVKTVEFTVNGERLCYSTGQEIGPMTASLFIDNDGNEINTYEHARVKLFFANQAGDMLIGAYRSKYYSTTMPMERFVVEELILGPSGKVEGLYPTIHPETKIISVTTQDGVCYVNFDASFMTSVNNEPIEVPIYSVVNSLTELNNVNKVQILVNGEVPASFGSLVFERNLDYVE